MKTTNPILRREIAFQHHSVKRSVQIMDSVGIVAVTLGLVLFMLWQMLISLQRAFDEPLVSVSFAVMAWAQVCVWVIHALAIIRAVSAGFQVVHRTRPLMDWDVLKLTNITPLKVLQAHWWAAFHQVRGWMLALGIIQLALVGVMATDYVVRLHINDYSFCYGNARVMPIELARCGLWTSHFWPSWEVWAPRELGAAVALAVSLSVAEMMASAAVGVAVGLLMRGKWFALPAALFIRFLPVIVFSLWPNYYSWLYYIPATEIWAWRWSEYGWFSLADGITPSLMRLSVMIGFGCDTQRCYQTNRVGLLLAAGAGMFTVFFTVSMVTGWLALRREGFSAATTNPRIVLYLRQRFWRGKIRPSDTG